MEAKEGQVAITSPEFKTHSWISEWLAANAEAIKAALKGTEVKVGRSQSDPGLNSHVTTERLSSTGEALQVVLAFGSFSAMNPEGSWRVMHNENLPADAGWREVMDGYFQHVTINPDGNGLDLKGSDVARDITYHIGSDGVVTVTATPKIISSDLKT